jgi:hypothetical protein
MKKVIFLLGLAMIIALSACKKDNRNGGGGSEKLTCTITSPQNGAELSIIEDIVVTVEAKSSTGTVPDSNGLFGRHAVYYCHDSALHDYYSFRIAYSWKSVFLK